MTVELSYAGRTLRILPPREAMRIERYMSTSDLHEWDQRDFQNGIGHLPLPEVYYPNFRLGSLWWPTGASKFAVGRYVINQSDLDVIGPLALPTAGPVENVLRLSNDSNDFSAGLFLLPPRPMFVTQAGTQPTYFITLVDKRFYWWYKAGVIESSDLTSWSTLLDAILLQLGETSAIIDPISEDYGEPSRRWISQYQFLPMLLDAACFACGLRCVRRLDGTVHLQNICTARTINATEILKAYPNDPYAGSGSGSGVPTYIPVMGGLYKQPHIASSVPSSVQVVQTENYSAIVPLLDLGLSGFGYEGVVGFAGAKVIFGDPNGSGSGSGSGSGLGCCNSTEIGYNRRVARDWYCWQLSTPDVMFQNLVDWNINGLNEYIEIRWTTSHITTEVRKPTINNRVLGALFGSGDPLDRLRFARSGGLSGNCSGSGPITDIFFVDENGVCQSIACATSCGSGTGSGTGGMSGSGSGNIFDVSLPQCCVVNLPRFVDFTLTGTAPTGDCVNFPLAGFQGRAPFDDFAQGWTFSFGNGNGLTCPNFHGSILSGLVYCQGPSTFAINISTALNGCDIQTGCNPATYNYILTINQCDPLHLQFFIQALGNGGGETSPGSWTLDMVASH